MIDPHQRAKAEEMLAEALAHEEYGDAAVLRDFLNGTSGRPYHQMSLPQRSVRRGGSLARTLAESLERTAARISRDRTILITLAICAAALLSACTAHRPAHRLHLPDHHRSA